MISQSPEGGTKAPNGSAVTIRISQGAEDNKVRVPDLIRLSEMDAMATITESGLNVGSVKEVNHEDESLNGLVCYQSYSVGSYVDPGTAIDLQVSIGPKQGTYSYVGSIEAPSAAEDPEYRDGLNVTVTIDTAVKYEHSIFPDFRKLHGNTVGYGNCYFHLYGNYGCNYPDEPGNRGSNHNGRQRGTEDCVQGSAVYAGIVSESAEEMKFH